MVDFKIRVSRKEYELLRRIKNHYKKEGLLLSDSEAYRILINKYSKKFREVDDDWLKWFEPF